LIPKTIGEVARKCNIDSILDKIIILTRISKIELINIIDKYIKIGRETSLVIIGVIGSILLLASPVIQP
jgi:hypothetical protein